MERSGRHAPTTMLRFRTLGVLTLVDSEGRPLHGLLARPKCVALLARLTATGRPPGFVRRDTLLATFWPELDEDHGRHALRQVLYRLKRELGEATFLRRGDEELAIDSGRLWNDVSALGRLHRAGHLRAAFRLYRGEFMEGFHLPEAPGFDRWLDAEREALREEAAEVAWALAVEADRRGAEVDAAGWARRAYRLVPWDEAGLRRAMIFLDRIGDRGAALRLFAEYARHLRREYGAEPAPRTLELARAVGLGRNGPRATGGDEGDAR